MRTTKTISVSVPPNQFKEMARLARKENRTMSELLREAFRRYAQLSTPPATLEDALKLIRTDAQQKGAGRLTQNEIAAEIAAYRQQPGRKKLKRTA